MPSLTRRQFHRAAILASGSLLTAVPGGLTNVLARSPIERRGEPLLRPSIAAYSLRAYFPFMKGKPQSAPADGPALDLFGFIDYCGSLDCHAAELTGYFLPPDADREYLLRLKHHAFLRGVTISGSAIGNDFSVAAGEPLEKQIAETQSWIERSAIMGAPHLRIFAGTAKQLGDSQEKLAQVADAVNRCAVAAEKWGVFLGVENHGAISSDQLLSVIEKVDSPWVGINLDTGNFISEDPYEDLRRCAPHAVNVQLKVDMKKPGGGRYPADLDRIIRILRDANYQGFVAVEYEEENPYEQIPIQLDRLRRAIAS